MQTLPYSPYSPKDILLAEHSNSWTCVWIWIVDIRRYLSTTTYSSSPKYSCGSGFFWSSYFSSVLSNILFCSTINDCTFQCYWCWPLLYQSAFGHWIFIISTKKRQLWYRNLYVILQASQNYRKLDHAVFSQAQNFLESVLITISEVLGHPQWLLLIETTCYMSNIYLWP